MMLNCILLFFTRHNAQYNPGVCCGVVQWRIAPVVFGDSGRLQWSALMQTFRNTQGCGTVGSSGSFLPLMCRSGGECAVSGSVGDPLWRCVVSVEDWAPRCHSVLVLQWPHLRFAAHERGALWFMSLHENSIIALKMRCELCHKSLGFPRLIPKMIHNVLLML